MRVWLIMFGFLGFLLAAPVAAQAEGDAAAVPTPEFEYVDMKPLVLPIITERGLTQQVSLVISLEIPYGTKDSIKAMEPKLADAYISDLYGALGSGHGLMKGSIIDVSAVKARLAKNTLKVLGPDKVNDVLLQVVQQSQR
ncbi:MAG TPA: flagellar basal body-associated FliL family protein [Patescibacteria group bacterium]|nr:flagellar basal body-associated FliL family protein [Patescibacteria group bacterium]